MTHAPSYTLVYDGECRLCQRAVSAVRLLDPAGHIETVPSQAPGVHERFASISPAAFGQAMQLIRADGATWSGAAAVEEVIRVLPRTRWFAPIFYIPLVRALADATYRWVARNRHKLGCGDHCST